MRIVKIVTRIALISFTACTTEQPKAIEQTASCLYPVNQFVDGLKQGIWVVSTSKDTTVYLNDTAYYGAAPMTSGEVCRMLELKGNVGMLNLPSGFGVQSK